MADQTETSTTPDEGTNPDPASWVDPNASKGEFADGHPGEPVDEGTLYIENRVAKLKAAGEYGEESIESTSVVEDKTETAKEGSSKSEETEEAASPEEDKREVYSANLLRLMEKEAEVRREREELSEVRSQVEAYNKAIAKAKNDPIATLKALGVTSEQMLEVAKAAYYENLGEEAPKEYSTERKLAAMQAELEALKAGTTERTTQAKDAELLNAYRGTLNAELAQVDLESNPLIGKITAQFGKEGVQEDLLTAASHWAGANQGATPTPKQAMETLNKLYQDKFGFMLEKIVSEEKPGKEVSGKKTKTIRNKTTKAQLEPEGIEKYADSHGDASDYQALSKTCRSNFYAELKAKG
jgi:hypothetical protein